MSVTRSLLYAAANVLHPRMLWLMLWPMLGALAFWGSLAVVLWSRLVVRIDAPMVAAKAMPRPPETMLAGRRQAQGED